MNWPAGIVKLTQKIESCTPCHALPHTLPTDNVDFHWVAQPLWANEHSLDSTTAFEGP
jgi:hypothetical protein